jgi:hypothetical protein
MGKLIGAEGCETPAGRAGQVRLLMAQSARRLTARPAESEHPGAEINHLHKQQGMRKKAFYFYGNDIKEEKQ